jgi:hypothetical protein
MPRLLTYTPLFPQIGNIRSLPSNASSTYIFNIINAPSQIVRQSQIVNWPTSCGYTKDLLRNPEIRNPSLNVSTPVNLLPNGEFATKDDEERQVGLGDLPFGLVVSKRVDAVDSPSLYDISTVQYTVNATDSGHVSIMHRPDEAKIVNEVVKKIWDRAVRGIAF